MMWAAAFSIVAMPNAGWAQPGARTISLADAAKSAERRVFLRGGYSFNNSVTVGRDGDTTKFEGDGENTFIDAGISIPLPETANWSMQFSGGTYLTEDDEAYSLLASLHIQNPITPRFGSYLTVGLGLLLEEVDDGIIVGMPTGEEEWDAFFAYQARAGVEMMLREGLSAETGYRLFGYTDNGLHVREHIVELGLNQAF